MSVLPRTAGYPGPPERFNKLRDRFNDELHRLADYCPGIYVKDVAGFSFAPDETPLHVSDWSPDGSHPGRNSSHPSFMKYLQEIRAALNSSVPKAAEFRFPDGE